MNTSSSPELNPSLFDSTAITSTKTTGLCTTHQIRQWVFPGSFPFELTEEFWRTFSSEDFVLLPSSYRLAYWDLHVRQPAWQKEVEDTAAFNRTIQDEYFALLDVTQHNNEQINEINRKRQSEFQQSLQSYGVELSEYARSHKNYEDQLEPWRIAVLEFQKKRCVEELRDVVNYQKTDIEHALNQVRESTEKSIASSFEAKCMKMLIGLAILALPLAVTGNYDSPSAHLSAFCCLLAYLLRKHLEATYRRRVANELTTYNERPAAEMEQTRRYVFMTCMDAEVCDTQYSLPTPVHFLWHQQQDRIPARPDRQPPILAH